MNLNKDDFIIVGNKIYAFCYGCGKLVRLNKPIIGSMHACGIKEESKSDSERKTDELANNTKSHS